LARTSAQTSRIEPPDISIDSEEVVYISSGPVLGVAGQQTDALERQVELVGRNLAQRRDRRPGRSRPCPRRCARCGLH
jgi:hypothetical protein